jgi:hypothetical protein
LAPEIVIIDDPMEVPTSRGLSPLAGLRTVAAERGAAVLVSAAVGFLAEGVQGWLGRASDEADRRSRVLEAAQVRLEASALTEDGVLLKVQNLDQDGGRSITLTFRPHLRVGEVV